MYTIRYVFSCHSLETRTCETAKIYIIMCIVIPVLHKCIDSVEQVGRDVTSMHSTYFHPDFIHVISYFDSNTKNSLPVDNIQKISCKQGWRNYLVSCDS